MEVLVDACSAPALPVACVDGVGGLLGRSLYIGLGSAGASWYALDLDAMDAGWQRRADLPAPPPSCAAAATVGGKLYVFGGFGRSSATATTAQFDTAYCYDPLLDRWDQLPSRLPVGLTGAAAIQAGPKHLIFLGGYNRRQFDEFHRELERSTPAEAEWLNRVYMNRAVDRYEWNADLWCYDISEDGWTRLGSVPHWPNCKSAVVLRGQDLHLFGGEVKPGLRAMTAKHGLVHDGGIDWCAEQAMPCGDGLAGSFAGALDSAVIAAGGTNFPGSWARYRQGSHFAHQGLGKTWHDGVYMLDIDVWRAVGQLPHPRANGLGVVVGEQLFIVGGDTQDGRPCLETWRLTLSGMSPSGHQS